MKQVDHRNKYLKLQFKSFSNWEELYHRICIGGGAKNLIRITKEKYEMSSRKRLYDYIKKNGTKEYPGKDLGVVANIRDWGRSLRQLRQDDIINYEYQIDKDTYFISEITDYKKSTKRMGLTAKKKYSIRHRDGHRCQSCGKGVNDGVKLVVDHKIPVDCGGSHNDENLWTLCQTCNGAKQAFFKDEFDVKVMRKVFNQKSGSQRIRVLFKNSHGKRFAPSIIQGIAGIRDWERSLRAIRKRYNLNIEWNGASKEYPDGYYIYR